jgi:HlyD family secretion protein
MTVGKTQTPNAPKDTSKETLEPRMPVTDAFAEEPSGKKPKRPVIIAAVALAALAAYFIGRHFFAPGFRYAGTIEATRIDLPARVATVVQSIDVQEGDKVKKDQKIATLACDDIRVNAKLANDNYARALKLRGAGSIAEEAFDQIANKKQDSDMRMSWCDITAPVSGTVLNRFLEPSEWANPGAKIISIANLADIWAYVYVPQEVMSRLKVGTEVMGHVPELGDRVFKGRIRKINEEAEFTPKNVQTQAERTRLVFGLKVAFENSDEILKPGMTIEVDIP